MFISENKTALFFRLSISLTVAGALLKFFSLPLIIIGATGMVIFHTIQFFQKSKRLPLDYARQFLIVSFACNFVFSTLNLPYTFLLMSLTRAMLIIFILLYIKEIIVPFQKTNANNLVLLNLGTEKLSNVLADIATVYIVIASLFRILHWEFGIINANLLLVIGLFSALISMLASSKILSK